MGLNIIVALAHGNVIGNKGEMPWGHIPRDLAHFKDITMGHTIVMGSKTFMAIGKLLHGRRTIVLTNHPEKFTRFNGAVSTAENIETIIEMAKLRRTFIIGGENVYRQFIERQEVKTMYLTRIYDAKFHGDAFFPDFCTQKWHMAKKEAHGISPENKYPICFETWIRN